MYFTSHYFLKGYVAQEKCTSSRALCELAERFLCCWGQEVQLCPCGPPNARGRAVRADNPPPCGAEGWPGGLGMGSPLQTLAAASGCVTELVTQKQQTQTEILGAAWLHALTPTHLHQVDRTALPA